MKKHSRLFQNRYIAICSMIIVGIAALGTRAWSSGNLPNQDLSTATAPQEQGRKVERLKYKKEPVEITAVKNNKGEIETDKDFLGDDDWLRNFTVIVDNTSGKTITSLTVDLVFLRPENHETSKEPPLVYPLTFGPSISSPRDYVKRNSLKVIKPGERTELVLSNDNHEFIKRALNELKYPASIKRVEILLKEVGFEDGTSWHGGELFRPDPNNPDKLIRVSQIGVRSTSTVKFLKTSFTIPQQITEPGRCGYAEGQTWLWCEPGFPDDCQRRITRVFEGAPHNVEIRAVIEPCLRWVDSQSAYVYCGPLELSLNTRPCQPPTTCPLACSYTGEPTFCDSAYDTCRYRYTGCPPDRTHDGTGCCCYNPSPIVVDVASNGFNLTNAENGVNFDINADGTRERLSWTAASSDDAWLALDRNSNGTIDNGAELFGNFTPQPPSSAPHGFLALAEFDKPANGGNLDGEITSSDTVFSRLRLWQDTNHNGISEAAELKTLPSMNVNGMELRYVDRSYRDRHGNNFRYHSVVYANRTDPRTWRWASDVFLLPGRTTP